METWLWRYNFSGKNACQFFKSTNFPFCILEHANLEKLTQRAWMWLNLYGCQAALAKVTLILKTLKMHFSTKMAFFRTAWQPSQFPGGYMQKIDPPLFIAFSNWYGFLRPPRKISGCVSLAPRKHFFILCIHSKFLSPKVGPLWKKCFPRAKETHPDILRGGHRNPYQLENAI